MPFPSSSTRICSADGHNRLLVREKSGPSAVGRRSADVNTPQPRKPPVHSYGPSTPARAAGAREKGKKGKRRYTTGRWRSRAREVQESHCPLDFARSVSRQGAAIKKKGEKKRERERRKREARAQAERAGLFSTREVEWRNTRLGLDLKSRGPFAAVPTPPPPPRRGPWTP